MEDTEQGTTMKRLRLWNGLTVKVQFQFEPRDLWVGVFWRRTTLCLHWYICFIPALPLHITILKKHYRQALRGVPKESP